MLRRGEGEERRRLCVRDKDLYYPYPYWILHGLYPTRSGVPGKTSQMAGLHTGGTTLGMQLARLQLTRLQFIISLDKLTILDLESYKANNPTAVLGLCNTLTFGEAGA